MKTVPLSTTYDGAVLSGEIEVLQGGVCVRMSAPYPGLLLRRMMRTSPLQSEAQCELTGRTLLEQLYVEARGIVDHREVYERVAAIAQAEQARWQQETDELMKQQRELQQKNSLGELGLEEFVARQTALNAQVVARKEAFTQSVSQACEAEGVKPVDPQFLMEVNALRTGNEV